MAGLDDATGDGALLVGGTGSGLDTDPALLGLGRT